MFEISNGIAVQILEVTGRERVMLLFDVIIPVPHCTEQWGTADCNEYITLPIRFTAYYVMSADYMTQSPTTSYQTSIKYDNLGTFRINTNSQEPSPQSRWLAVGY